MKRFVFSVVLVVAIFVHSGTEVGFASDPSDGAVSVTGSDGEANDGLVANQWFWTKLAPPGGAIDIDRPSNYTLDFRSDGSLLIKADCNRASGSFSVDGAKLSIKLGPTTLAACPGASRGEELLQLLGKTERFAIAGEMLILILNNETSLAFNPPSIVDRCGEKAILPNKIADTLEPEISSALDKSLAGFIVSGIRSSPGASMLVITPKGRYFKSAGVADVATCSPLRADSPFQIGSNTKMMTAAIIYQLHEKGQLSTSDRLSKWLPEIASKLPYGDEITIDMLLTHTSGLFDYFDVDPGDGGIGAGVAKKEILTQGFTPLQLVERVADSGKANFKPGEAGKWKYCNTGYILLGLIIEKATRKTFEENLKTRIFRPLKLKKTYLQKNQPAPGILPQAYYQPPFNFTTGEWNASQGWSAGAVVSTSDEFAVFLKALFTGKLFKKKTTLALMSELSAPSKDALAAGTMYGHGMFNNGGVLGHGGQTLGFQSDGGYLPEKDITIVIWGNSATSGVTRTAVPNLAKIVSGDQ